MNYNSVPNGLKSGTENNLFSRNGSKNENWNGKYNAKIQKGDITI